MTTTPAGTPQPDPSPDTASPDTAGPVPGSVQVSYHHPGRRPARRTADGTVHVLLGRHWQRVRNPIIATTFRPEPAAGALHHALTNHGYPGPLLAPAEMADTIPAAWICHVLANRHVTPYALTHDLPTYHPANWT